MNIEESRQKFHELFLKDNDLADEDSIDIGKRYHQEREIYLIDQAMKEQRVLCVNAWDDWMHVLHVNPTSEDIAKAILNAPTPLEMHGKINPHTPTMLIAIEKMKGLT